MHCLIWLWAQLYRAMDYIPFKGRESSNNFREIDVSRNWNGPENLLKDLDINQSGQYAVFLIPSTDLSLLSIYYVT